MQINVDASVIIKRAGTLEPVSGFTVGMFTDVLQCKQGSQEEICKSGQGLCQTRQILPIATCEMKVKAGNYYYFLRVSLGLQPYRCR